MLGLAAVQVALDAEAQELRMEDRRDKVGQQLAPKRGVAHAGAHAADVDHEGGELVLFGDQLLGAVVLDVLVAIMIEILEKTND